MFKKGSIIALLGCLFMAAIITACGGGNDTPAAPAARARPETDREGYPITLPNEINTIVTLGPSNAEILVALGFGDKIIATDRYAEDVAGLGVGVPRAFGITDFDAEYIIDLAPDILLVSGLARVGGDDDPLAPISDVGISVIHMPSSESIAAIMEDIRFIAAVMEAYEAGEEIISMMQSEIDEIRQISASATEARTVYFEISPAPWMWSTGSGTFLHEMMEIVGAVNIFADHYDGFLSVSEEILLELNPDVILTSVDFIDDPIADIMERPGFDAIAAVQNEAVFRIDTAASNRPSQNIVIALRQIARAVFPEYFQ
jgi:iron complex transport system substrate-binding protein